MNFLTPVGRLEGGRLALRPAHARDLDELVALDRTCFGAQAWERLHWWQAIRESGTTTLLLCAGERTVAALVLIAWPPVASLASLAVHPDLRGRGLGRGLVEEAIARSRAAGARWLALEVDADNRGAIGLYRRAGFVVERRFAEDGRPRLGMLRRLARAPEPRPAGRLL